MNWKVLTISFFLLCIMGFAVMLNALYFTVKWAVKNGVKEAFQKMKETEETT